MSDSNLPSTIRQVAKVVDKQLADAAKREEHLFKTSLDCRLKLVAARACLSQCLSAQMHPKSELSQYILRTLEETTP